MMQPETKKQIFQSVGQFLVIVVTGLLVYPDVAALMKVGVLNALWQPCLQGLLGALGVYGVSKIGPKVAVVVLALGLWRPFVLTLLVGLLVGCSSIYGPTGQYDGTLTCKGKGSLTGNGALSIGAGYGGSGTNAWTIQGDCGEGFSIERSRERERPPAPQGPALR